MAEALRVWVTILPLVAVVSLLAAVAGLQCAHRRRVATMDRQISSLSQELHRLQTKLERFGEPVTDGPESEPDWDALRRRYQDLPGPER